ncbi:GNAT family N-acetyltransferase [Roseomonas sp. PWR1]|uniref:GNAT family N-acetyltransferase n=1 Tax=Roseomonas nitratireducens TaxID=2820810 RepID=A0ABS4AMM8_9PROT|nr:GNAT family N-acetyltransferase [Neoroseomonas nitratireducens]MBP0462619.1 GNAT family N-acetyltransferase [Neoroseomonas nitratireducens]
MIQVREATAPDSDAVADLLTASWRDAYAPLLPAAVLDRLPALHRDMWRAHFAAPRDGIVLLAEEDGALAGFCAAWLEDGECYVDNLHLRPGRRGGGLGPLLLGEAAAALAARGATRAALTIIEGNDRAARFYARLGGIAQPPHPAELHGARVMFRRFAWPDIAALVAACAVPAPSDRTE